MRKESGLWHIAMEFNAASDKNSISQLSSDLKWNPRERRIRGGVRSRLHRLNTPSQEPIPPHA